MSDRFENWYVCDDCAMWHTNADLSGVDDPERVAEIKKCEEPLVVDCGEEAEECLSLIHI